MLEGRLPDDLKGRVGFHWDVYRREGHCPTECHVMSIFVDGECWFHTNQRFWDVKYGAKPEPRDDDIIRETGLVENYWGDTVSEYIHQFFNVLSIEEAIVHDNYFIRLLAVLTHDLGNAGSKRLRTTLKMSRNGSASGFCFVPRRRAPRVAGSRLRFAAAFGTICAGGAHGTCKN